MNSIDLFLQVQAMDTEHEDSLLTRVAEALRGHGLTVAVDRVYESPPDRRGLTWLRIGRWSGRYEYAAAAWQRLSRATVGSTVAQLRHPRDAGAPPVLLVTEYVTPPLAELLRGHEQQFADAAGNAYLDTGGLFVYVTGRKPQPKRLAVKEVRRFTTSRLKVLFALICTPELVAAPYRLIAAAAGVALGSVSTVLAGLQRDGLLLRTEGRRCLCADKRLLDDWAHGYALGLRGKTLSGRYVAPHFAEWRNWRLNPEQARWGGEPAAKLLGCDLSPSVLTLYGDRLPARLVTREALAAAGPVAYENLLELRRPFWGPSLCTGERHATVATPLVYADLLATGNRLCVDAAENVYDTYLARRFPSR